jgi:hypothetical protein
MYFEGFHVYVPRWYPSQPGSLGNRDAIIPSWSTTVLTRSATLVSEDVAVSSGWQLDKAGRKYQQLH